MSAASVLPELQARQRRTVNYIIAALIKLNYQAVLVSVFLLKHQKHSITWYRAVCYHFLCFLSIGNHLTLYICSKLWDVINKSIIALKKWETVIKLSTTILHWAGRKRSSCVVLCVVEQKLWALGHGHGPLGAAVRVWVLWAVECCLRGLSLFQHILQILYHTEISIVC